MPIFINFKNYRLQTCSVWKNLKFVVWERVKRFPTMSRKKHRIMWQWVNFLCKSPQLVVLTPSLPNK